MRRWLAVLFLVGLVVVLAVAGTGFRAVRPGERVVVRRFGRLVGPAWEPGLHWACHWESTASILCRQTRCDAWSWAWRKRARARSIRARASS